MENNEYSDVICASCEDVYENVGMGNNQGYRCSAEVHGDEIHGFYGSTEIDGLIWEFVKKPAWVVDGIICDDCIKKLKKDKMIIEKEINLWFGRNKKGVKEADVEDILKALNLVKHKEINDLNDKEFFILK